MNFKERLHKIRCFAFDIDGVLTNGQLLVTHEGQQLRSMNIKDGYAMQLAVKKGYNVFILSGAISEGVQKRLNGLGIKEVYSGLFSKLEKLDELMAQYNLSYENVLYMGDDMPDLSCMQAVSVATCPGDAVMQIRAASIYISEKKGGEGCVRDVIEQVLTLQGNWE